MRLDASFLTKALPPSSRIQGTLPKNFPYPEAKSSKSGKPEGSVDAAHSVAGNPAAENSAFVVDSRIVKPGDIFVALPGVHTDGHDFLQDALERGAAGIMVQESKLDRVKALPKAVLSTAVLGTKAVIIVPDTLQALVAVASAWRAQFNIPIIAITGSVGKTSTKSLVAAMLHRAGKNFLVSQGNQNTLIGVALNILRLTDVYEGAVFEIGINQRGEMARIVALLKPTTALITCIGHSHLQGLNSLRDVAIEKRIIFSGLSEQAVGFIYGDQSELSSVAYQHLIIRFGFKTTNQIQARKVVYGSTTTSLVLKIYGQKYNVVLPHNHSGGVLNALAAVALAHYLGVPPTIIIQTLEQAVVVPGRFEQRKLKQGSGLIINDCYNASPESMKAALLALQKYETTAQKIAVLGDMLELGPDSAYWHRQIGRFLRKVPTLSHVVLVGSMVEWTKKTMPLGIAVVHVATWHKALELVQQRLAQDAVVLVKGSRGMALHNLVEALS